MMFTGILTSVNRTRPSIIGFNLDNIRFEMPSIGGHFKFHITTEGEEGVYYGGRQIETIIEEEGRAGRRLVIITDEQEFIVRNVQAEQT